MNCIQKSEKETPIDATRKTHRQGVVGTFPIN